ncbi:MAG: class I SAM-dependent methyltransferase [Leptolyngbya sp. DLM2.Bin15]|nr:MAG: class I SAM-dependent methyltransferase [Leptolyngbya sp. DLM2.Bin15]
MPNKNDSNYIPALGFRWLTPFYDAVVGATTRERTFKQALIQQAEIESRQSVLDLACGTGTLSIWIKQGSSETEVIGVDGDPAVLSLASRKAARTKVSVQFDEAMSYALPYPNARFDRVVSSLFFHHLSCLDKKLSVQEVFRVLRPGGQLHVADWGKSTNFVMRCLFFSIQILDGFSNTQDNVDGKLIDLFEKAGFVDVSQEQTFGTIFGTMSLYSAVKPG